MVIYCFLESHSRIKANICWYHHTIKPGPAAVNMLPHVSLCKGNKNPSLDCLIKSHMPSANAHLAILCNVLFGGPVVQLSPPKHKWMQETGNNHSHCSFSPHQQNKSCCCCCTAIERNANVIARHKIMHFQS